MVLLQQTLINMNAKEKIIFILVGGLVGLLFVITLGDFYVSIREHKPVDEGIINLLKMSITGIIGIVAGYMSRSKCHCHGDDEE
tara:strand:+ start:2809 stop:3060 length:252 start_codon:yes stop_codon:yes gene_type:complete